MEIGPLLLLRPRHRRIRRISPTAPVLLLVVVAVAILMLTPVLYVHHSELTALLLMELVGVPDVLLVLLVDGVGLRGVLHQRGRFLLK